MARFNASRRRLLKALGLASAAATPVFFPGLVRANSNGPIPKRFLGLLHANGWRVAPRDSVLYKTAEFEAVRDSFFFPKRQRSANYAISAQDSPWPLAIDPLRRHAKHLTILDGLSNHANGGANSHSCGGYTFFSGKTPVHNFNRPGGQTIDQHIALLDTRPLSGLNVGVGERTAAAQISATGAAQPNWSLTDPVVAFERVFATLAQGENAAQKQAELQKLRVSQKSVLDQSAKELAAIAKWMTGADRERLDIHTSSIRSLEKRLLADPRSHHACTLLAEPQGLDPRNDANTPELSDFFLDLIATAFACDITRVGSMFYGFSTGSYVATWLGHTDHLHAMSHWGLRDERQAQYTQALGWISEQVAGLLDRLENIKESDGKSLLHHSLLCWGTDNSSGQLHTVRDLPVILAGHAAGSLAGGKVQSFELDTPVNRLLMAIAGQFGPPVSSFGDPKWCGQGALTGVFEG